MQLGMNFSKYQKNSETRTHIWGCLPTLFLYETVALSVSIQGQLVDAWGYIYSL